MLDVIVVGAGPAGAMAALTLARAGVRVLVVERATRPRDAAWGGVLSPRVAPLLAAVDLSWRDAPGVRALRGWRVHVPGAPPAIVVPRAGEAGPLAVHRGAFDAWLLAAAVRAGARLEEGWHVRAPLVHDESGAIRGVVMRRRSAPRVRMPAPLVIAADGRSSRLARGVVPHGACSERWRIVHGAVGDAGVPDLADVVEGPRMHGGASPVDGRVMGWTAYGSAKNASAIVDDGERVRDARQGVTVQWMRVRKARGLPPAGVPGLLFAGDAARPVDPLGDGIGAAMLGGQLAAEAAIAALESSDLVVAVRRLTASRAARFEAMWRAARRRCWLRAHPRVLALVGRGQRFAPGLAIRWRIHETFT